MRALFNRLFRGHEAATVPSMDGALRANTALDQAGVLAKIPSPDNLVPFEGDLLFSSGTDIWRLAKGKAMALHHRFASRVTAMAVSPGGLLAVGLEGIGVQIGGKALGTLDGRLTKGPTALSFVDDGALAVAIGSAQNGPEDWQRDLMEKRSTGSVWTLPVAGGAGVCVADGLAWPNGLLLQDGRIIVSESWNHRLLAFDLAARNARPEVVLEDLPGYAGRLAPGKDGGAWLAVFAPRSQLIEFVLRERAYCTRMLRDIPKEFWIAPSFRSGRSFREPMQGGAVRVHGIFKPWAPTRSYGLVVQLDRNLSPVRSFHSRADGTRHGITSICEWQGEAAFASRGDDAVGLLSLQTDAA
jgi:hypothetical protein